MGELEQMWNKNKSIKSKSISQILAWVKDLDEEERKEELRKFFKIIPINQIKKYINECRNEKFEWNGFIFQDLVNELGRRLGYKITYGRYKGVKGEVGYDGLWTNKEGHTFVVESKVTDVFSIDLDVVFNYRQDLINQKKISDSKSSIILVLGRKESNNFPNVVSGSKYKWVMNVVGVDSLVSLAKHKEQNENSKLLDKQIFGVLKMEDCVESDKLVELVFPDEEDTEENYNTRDMEHTNFENNKLAGGDKINLPYNKRPQSVQFYSECINRICKVKKINLKKKEDRKKVLYEDKENDIGVVIINSKLTKEKLYNSFWFAYHSYYKEYLKDYKTKYIALGCGSEENILLMPFELMESKIEKMQYTKRKDRCHWHVYIKQQNGKFLMNTPLDYEKWLDVSEYKI